MKNFNPENFPSILDQTDEEVFRAYVEDLQLKPEDFNKKILDVGAGGGQFAKWARAHGVSNEIYSLEPDAKYLFEKDKSVIASAEKIPLENESFDLVVSNGAIPNIYIDSGDVEEIKDKIKSSFNEMVRILKLGGEVRLARVLIGQEYESQKIVARGINEAIEKLEKENNIKVEKTRMPYCDTYEYDNNHEPIKILAEAYLIKMRKPE